MTVTPVLSAAHTWVLRRQQAKRITTVTADHQRRVLSGFAACMGSRRPENIGTSDIERWMATIAHTAPGTRRNRFAIVRLFFDALVDDDASPVRRNPARRIPPPTVPKSRHRALTGVQVAAILRACPDELALAYVLMGFQCGLRRAEVAGIEVGDICWEVPNVTVTGKGGHVRTIPVPDEAARAVERYLLARPANGGPLFRQRRFPVLGVSPDWVGEDFVSIAYASGVKTAARDGVSFHAARHTAATDIYRACKDVVAVRDILGHVSLATTHRYVAGMDQDGMALAMSGRTYQAAVA